MSRSGYSDDYDQEGWEVAMWRGAVNSAIKGKRGQALLSDMAKALDAMPVKRLIAHELVSGDGEVCALGAVAKHKCLKVENLDPEDSEQVASLFNIADALAREIAYENDEGFWEIETPEQRWQRMRKWVDENLGLKEGQKEGV